VVHEDGKGPLELLLVQDQQPVQTLRANGAHKPLRHPVRLRGTKRRADDFQAIASKHLVNTVAGAFAKTRARSSHRACRPVRDPLREAMCAPSTPRPRTQGPSSRRRCADTRPGLVHPSRSIVSACPARRPPGWRRYAGCIKDDGTDLKKTIPTPGLVSFAVSPHGRWVPAEDSRAWGSLFLFPTGGGSPTLICSSCSPPHGPDPIPPHMSWSPDRRFLYLKFNASLYEIPLQPGQMLPTIPASGFQSTEAVAALPGARLISEDDSLDPGPNPSIYAFTKVATQRNIYRVPVP
jgi:hypothetical protein